MKTLQTEYKIEWHESPSPGITFVKIEDGDVCTVERFSLASAKEFLNKLTSAIECAEDSNA